MKRLINFRWLTWQPVLACLLAALLAACGGGGGAFCPPSGTNRLVTLAWTPNHEQGVNSAGGGYKVAIGGQPMIRVPYSAGSAAPTSTQACLPAGTYSVTVQAYAALDVRGGNSGSLSLPSAPLTVVVPKP